MLSGKATCLTAVSEANQGWKNMFGIMRDTFSEAHIIFEQITSISWSLCWFIPFFGGYRRHFFVFANFLRSHRSQNRVLRCAPKVPTCLRLEGRMHLPLKTRHHHSQFGEGSAASTLPSAKTLEIGMCPAEASYARIWINQDLVYT